MALSYGEQMVHPKWIAKKEEILERDGHKCRVCNSNLYHLSVHHLCYLPDLLAWEYDNELLITICRRHLVKTVMKYGLMFMGINSQPN